MDTDTLIETLARDIGISAATLRKWRQRGSVPHHRRDDMREAASRRGTTVSRDAFDSFGQSRANAA